MNRRTLGFALLFLVLGAAVAVYASSETSWGLIKKNTESKSLMPAAKEIIPESPETLLRDQIVPVGTYGIGNSEGNLTIPVQLDAAWELVEWHLFVGDAAPDRPTPGKFPYSEEEFLPGTTDETIEIPLDELGAVPGTELVIALHLAIQEQVASGDCTELVPVVDPVTGEPVVDPITGEPVLEEIPVPCEDTAWAWGATQPWKQGWGMVTSYTVQ